MTEEQVQKGYVWMNEVNNNIFDATYDDIVAYFGVEGQFVKEEYSDHMKANYRYYKWISEDDDSHFIYVNFKENESGRLYGERVQHQRLLRHRSHRKVSGHREGRGRRGEQGSVCKRRDEGLLRGNRPVCKRRCEGQDHDEDPGIRLVVR